VILRTWRGWVETGRVAEYADYVERTGLTGYRETPGNRGCQFVSRELGDGRTEVVTLSWWDSLDAIRGFAGDDIEVAKFYPEDDGYLVERETVVRHYVVDRE
jgi:heme-degrading monooxygenase HmoA